MGWHEHVAAACGKKRRRRVRATPPLLGNASGQGGPRRRPETHRARDAKRRSDENGTLRFSERPVRNDGPGHEDAETDSDPDAETRVGLESRQRRESERLKTVEDARRQWKIAGDGGR